MCLDPEYDALPESACVSPDSAAEVIWACLADFRWHAEVSFGNLSSILLPPDRSQFGLDLALTTVGCTVPLRLVAPDRAESELEASVDRLFDEGGSGDQTEQGGSTSSGRGVDIQLTVIVDAGESLHPPKRLREDHRTPSEAYVGGKSMSAVQWLLARAVLNAEVRGEAIPTLPFVTSSVFAMPKREGGDHTDSVVGLNLRTISAPQRFVISSDSSHHSGANVAEAKVDSLVRSSILVMTVVTTVIAMTDPALVVKEKPVTLSLFSVDSSSAGEADPNTGKTYVPQWSVTNGSRLDDSHVCCEMVDEFAPPKFFGSVRRMEHDQLFTEFNVRVARQMSLSAEVRMCVEYNVKEMRRLKFVVEKQDELLKSREREIENLKAQLLLREAKVAEAIRLPASKGRELTDMNAQLTSVKSQNENLIDRVHELEVSSSGLQEKITVFEDCMEERFYPHLLTTISSHRWLLTYGMELAIAKCLNFPEYLSALGVAIGKAIEKGMHDGLSAGITHGTEGRALTDVTAYNPSAKADYIFALQQLQNFNFSLLAELRSNRDASIDTLMNILRLEETLAERLSLTESQPHVDQLMVPIHHSLDKVVVGATALSLALDVSNIRVRKIKDNIANQRSALRDVFIPLSKVFSAEFLMGTEGTSDVVPATADTTTTLSINFASASIIAPISVDDYEVVGTDDQADADGNAKPFPNVDDVELNIPR
ncbi:hypothetical protein Tco_1053712 [Tanacetum coccineum]|uniref:Transposase (Putative), gypsy type n=1 Tax=Tanacetum coccineum TaxID=301880 RepID=A0ABQ5GUQ7_9ASTR